MNYVWNTFWDGRADLFEWKKGETRSRILVFTSSMQFTESIVICFLSGFWRRSVSEVVQGAHNCLVGQDLPIDRFWHIATFPVCAAYFHVLSLWFLPRGMIRIWSSRADFRQSVCERRASHHMSHPWSDQILAVQKVLSAKCRIFHAGRRNCKRYCNATIVYSLREWILKAVTACRRLPHCYRLKSSFRNGRVVL
jgi:hypothetical protein